MHLKPKTNVIVNESVYVVKWTDRNYKEKSKKFRDDPNGPPENGRIKAEKFKSSLEKKDANDKFGNIRDISIVIESHKTMNLKQLIRATVREALEAQLGPSGGPIGSRHRGAYASRIHESYGSDFDGPGLVVTGRTTLDNNTIKDIIEDHQFIAYWNAREGYWFFPEEPETLDALEDELSATFDTFGVNARFESQE